MLERDGRTFTGANIENRSYGLTICAERSAVCLAAGQGVREIKAIAVYSPDSKYPVPPCGACRQVLTEFAMEGCIVIMAGPESARIETLSDLFPLDSLHELKSD